MELITSYQFTFILPPIEFQYTYGTSPSALREPSFCERPSISPRFSCENPCVLTRGRGKCVASKHIVEIYAKTFTSSFNFSANHHLFFMANWLISRTLFQYTKKYQHPASKMWVKREKEQRFKRKLPDGHRASHWSRPRRTSPRTSRRRSNSSTRTARHRRHGESRNSK